MKKKLNDFYDEQEKKYYEFSVQEFFFISERIFTSSLFPLFIFAEFSRRIRNCSSFALITAIHDPKLTLDDAKNQ
jgi:hypothetical protein